MTTIETTKRKVFALLLLAAALATSFAATPPAKAAVPASGDAAIYLARAGNWQAPVYSSATQDAERPAARAGAHEEARVANAQGATGLIASAGADRGARA